MSDYPREVPRRYEIRTGKWGQYFHDTKAGGKDGYDMPLNQVLQELELHELRKAQLRWYVEKFGEQP